MNSSRSRTKCFCEINSDRDYSDIEISWYTSRCEDLQKWSDSNCVQYARVTYEDYRLQISIITLYLIFRFISCAYIYIYIYIFCISHHRSQYDVLQIPLDRILIRDLTSRSKIFVHWNWQVSDLKEWLPDIDDVIDDFPKRKYRILDVMILDRHVLEFCHSVSFSERKNLMSHFGTWIV